MPELPDIVVYIEALEQRILGAVLERVQLGSPFLLRTANPPLTSVEGRKVIEVCRLGKRICIGLEGDLWLVLHLMIAGRLHWHTDSKKLSQSPKKRGLAAFEFANGTLSLTEAGTQRRASLHLVEGDAGLAAIDPGGLDVFQTDLKDFTGILQSANHTLKRALTDPHLFSGIGNAYSDEILFQARLSPITLTQKLKPEEIEQLFAATRSTLTNWIELLRAETYRTASGGDLIKSQPAEVIPRKAGSRKIKTSDPIPPRAKKTSKTSRSDVQTDMSFPENVTAFRPEMAVHGKYLQPCPRCGVKIQRIRYASNETNYCPVCQTGGKLLKDRALSRLLREDWPKQLMNAE
ncbi:MAG: DNA-formamidopyrimidine glycosylase family protein [bacterium]